MGSGKEGCLNYYGRNHRKYIIVHFMLVTIRLVVGSSLYDDDEGGCYDDDEAQRVCVYVNEGYIFHPKSLGKGIFFLQKNHKNWYLGAKLRSFFSENFSQQWKQSIRSKTGGFFRSTQIKIFIYIKKCLAFNSINLTRNRGNVHSGPPRADPCQGTISLTWFNLWIGNYTHCAY